MKNKSDKIFSFCLMLVCFSMLLLPSIKLIGILVVFSLAAKKLNFKIMHGIGINVLRSLDQLANAMTGGDPDEYISSRAAKLREKRRWACILCYLLDKIDKDHCKNAREDDEGEDGVVE